MVYDVDRLAVRRGARPSMVRSRFGGTNCTIGRHQDRHIDPSFVGACLCCDPGAAEGRRWRVSTILRALSCSSLMPLSLQARETGQGSSSRDARRWRREDFDDHLDKAARLTWNVYELLRNRSAPRQRTVCDPCKRWLAPVPLALQHLLPATARPRRLLYKIPSSGSRSHSSRLRYNT
jgi:hypothetical protein